MAHTIESLKEKFADLPEKRLPKIERAVALGCSDDLLEKLCDAVRCSDKPTVDLPAGRFEHLSRGRGWARLGKGDSAVWGEQVVAGHYRVSTPGRWVVGSNDGFSRKEQTEWRVEHVQVGEETWTLAW